MEAVKTDVLKNLLHTAASDLRAGKRSPEFAALVRAAEQAAPDLPRIGFAKTPKEEALRFGQKPALHFTGVQVAEVVNGNGGNGESLILTYFLGLLGVNGPMPLEFTNYVFQRSHSYYDHTWRRFLDIIHHRFHTFYYRAAAAGDQAISSDRPQDDPLKTVVASLTGFPAATAIPLGNAPQFAFTLKNRANLEALLQNEYRLPIHVQDFVLSHNDIPTENHVYLGARDRSVLGRTMQIGRQFLATAQKFEIRVGPMEYAQYCDFIRNPRGVIRMAKAVRLFLDRPLDFDVLPLVASEHIPGTRLGGIKIGARSYGRLGVGCWIGRLQSGTVTSNRISLSRILKRRSNGPHYDSYHYESQEDGGQI